MTFSCFYAILISSLYATLTLSGVDEVINKLEPLEKEVTAPVQTATQKKTLRSALWSIATFPYNAASAVVSSPVKLYRMATGPSTKELSDLKPKEAEQEIKELKSQMENTAIAKEHNELKPKEAEQEIKELKSQMENTAIAQEHNELKPNEETQMDKKATGGEHKWISGLKLEKKQKVKLAVLGALAGIGISLPVAYLLFDDLSQDSSEIFQNP